MVDAVVLLCVIPGEEHRVKKALIAIDEVKTCRITFGEYDLCLEVQTEKIKHLGSLITKKVRQIEGVTKSITLIISESLNNESNSS
ncbi:MAG: Lrp/AsnC ligand binding domain-containing protein [Candidatus Hodarchaeota archaeon]